MATTHAQKILRVGVIQGGKIIEERLLRKRSDVTIGQEAKNTIVVPASNLPATFPVFEFRNQQYALVFTEEMDGRVRLGNSDVDFASLRSQGLAKKRGNVYVLPLTEAAKGKISLGEVTLLFQFVNPPPEPPKTQLPPIAKGSFWQAVDQLFFIVLATSLFVHFTCAGFIISQPRPEERELSLDELPDRFAKVLIPVKIEQPKVEPTVQAGGDQKGDDKKGDDKPKGDKKPAGGGDPNARREAVAKAVSQKGLLKILGSVGGGGGGAFEDVLGGGGAGDVAAALAGAGGVGVATSDALGMGKGPKGGGTGTAVGIGDLGTSGGGNVNLGNKSDARVTGRVADAAPEVDSADVDRNALARFIKARISAIQSCYERELKRNPTLKGKVVIRFAITPQGRAAEIDVEENTLGSDAVSSCIRTVIRSWVFPFKPDDSVMVSYPFVFTPAS